MSQKSDKIIGLCPIHHRLGGADFSFHGQRKLFIEKFGTEEELHQLTEQLLNEYDN